MASSTVFTFTMRLLVIDTRKMSTRDSALAWLSTSFSISPKCFGARFTATSTTCESIPCSAWESKSAATKAGLAVWSAMT